MIRNRSTVATRMKNEHRLLLLGFVLLASLGAVVSIVQYYQP
jgi:hypothetical protein